MGTIEAGGLPEETSRSGLSRRNFLKMSAAVTGAVLPAAYAANTSATPLQGQYRVASFKASQANVTLKFLSRGGEFIAGVVDQQIAAFREQHPEIEIQHDQAAGDHVQRIQLDASAGTLPDAWFDANRTTGLWWHTDLIENLEPYLEQEPTFNEDDYVDYAWIAQTYEESRWGLPWDSGGMALLFNIDMFEEAGLPLPDPKKPMTWDELLETATQLTLDFNDNLPSDSGFDPTRVKRYGLLLDTTHGIHQWLNTNDAEVILPDPSGETELISPIDSPEAVEAFQFLADLGTKHYVAPDPAALQAQEISLQSQTTAMAHAGVWNLGRLNDAGVNWGAAPFPIKKTAVSYGHYSPLVMSNRSEHKQETFDWIYWACCSLEGEQILVDRGMQQPIRHDLAEEFIASANAPAKEYRQVFYDVFDPQTFKWPGDTIGTFWNGWDQPRIDLWDARLDAVWSGRVQYEEIAAELRRDTELALRTGEVT